MRMGYPLILPGLSCLTRNLQQERHLWDRSSGAPTEDANQRGSARRSNTRKGENTFQPLRFDNQAADRSAAGNGNLKRCQHQCSCALRFIGCRLRDITLHAYRQGSKRETPTRRSDETQQELVQGSSLRYPSLPTRLPDHTDQLQIPHPLRMPSSSAERLTVGWPSQRRGATMRGRLRD